jgi:hypothetical protein
MSYIYIYIFGPSYESICTYHMFLSDHSYNYVLVCQLIFGLSAEN